MPTIKPRIAVTLDSDAHEAVRYLALAQKRPMSKVIAEIIHSMVPVLSRLADITAAAQRATKEQRAGLVEIAQEAEKRLIPFAVQSGMEVERFMGAVERAAGGGGPAKRVAPPARTTRPPASNTGVRSPRGKSGKQGSKGRRR